MRGKGFPVTWTQSVHSMIYTKPKPVSHTHTCYSSIVEEPLKVLFVMAVGLAVAFC